MPRQREFDTDQALQRAMETFWARGYEAASMEDLCGAMELSRSSLYHAFGSKEELLRAALERYAHGTEARLRRHFETVRPVRRAVEELLDRLVADAAADGPRRGCFIGNCVAELGAGNTPAATVVRDSLLRVEGVFEAAFRRARETGELPPQANPRALARYLTLTVQGLRLVAKSQPDPRALREAAAVALHAFD